MPGFDPSPVYVRFMVDRHCDRFLLHYCIFYLMIIFLLCAGSVKVWDPRQKGKPVATMEPAEGDARRDCWTVAFGNQSNANCSLELF